VFLFFSFFFFFVLTAEFSFCMKKRSRIAGQRAEQPENCVDGESVNGEGKSVVRKKRS